MIEKIIKSPIKVTGERAWRTYVGGMKIDELTNVSNPEDTNFPELWILSTVKAVNSNRMDIIEGLGKICIDGYDDLNLADLIEKYPVEMLGRKYALSTGNKMGVLTKIIDSKERLTIQTHPTKQKAKKYFNSNYGKTEAWHILDTRDDNACIYLGFKENFSFNEFKQTFYDQDLYRMLGMLHKIKVNTGETYLIPGGFPHAIGESTMLIEIQEPTDYTLRVEKTTPFGLKINDIDCHRGIGIDNMFDCFDPIGYSIEKVLEKCRLSHPVMKISNNEVEQLITHEDTDCFAMEKITVKDQMHFTAEDDFFGIFMFEGSGNLVMGNSTDKNTVSFDTCDEFFIAPGCMDFAVKTGTRDPVVLFKIKGQAL